MPALAEHYPAESSAFDFYEWEAELDAARVGVLALDTAAYEAPPTDEARKSFDVLASVNMLRADLREYGRILPETRERVQDEELSLISEGVNRAARTEFALKRQGNDLVYYKNGKWESYTGMLLTGRQVAISEAVSDPRKRFLAEDAVRDLQYGLDMRTLKPGDRRVWTSPYRKDVEKKYGAAFMRECGRLPHRQMAFIYEAYCEDNGNIVLRSQTLDRSDHQALAAAEALAKRNPRATLDDMVDAYDSVLLKKGVVNGPVWAGRLAKEQRENAWRDILVQRDLIEYFYQRLEQLALSPLQGEVLEKAVKKHMYGVWAAFKKRLDSGQTSAYQPLTDGFPAVHMALLEHEVSGAFTDFANKGIAMIGCGGSIEILQGEENILSIDPSKVFESIFGKSIESDKDCEYVSKKCPMCNAKNVKTIDKGIGGGRRRISGSCGCSKEYVK